MIKFMQVLNEEKNQLIKDFILILLYTGMRKTNVLEMRWENISFSEKIWHIPKTKNGKSQNVVLTDEVIEILKDRKSESEWVFPSNKSHLQNPYKTWSKLCQKAGLKNLRIHDLRRTLGSWIAAAGASERIIAKALNHDDINSTKIYTIVIFNEVCV